MDLNPCPFNPNHINDSAYIVRFPNGAIAAGCHHNSCQGKGWPELRSIYEPGWQEARKEKRESAGESAGKEERKSQADLLVELALASGAEFFCDETGDTFAAIPVHGHREIWPIRGGDKPSRHFRRWLIRLFFEATDGKTPNSEAISQAFSVLEAWAAFRGSPRRLHLRVAEEAGVFWYDLADPSWRAVRITPEGWEVVERPPIHFRRFANTAPQVTPEREGDLRDLLRFVNISAGDPRKMEITDDELLLLVYCVAALVPGIPQPILDVYGEKGAGKSMAMRFIRALIDPAVEPLLVLRGDERELALLLAHNYFPVFDNLSRLSEWESDMLCRAATGGGLSVRQLYSDDEERIFSFCRPVGLTGVHLLTGGTDLMDRYLSIKLERIAKRSRKKETALREEFERLRPRLFGAMLDALSKAMVIYPGLEFEELPRMADWATWGAAISEALGFGAKRFMAAYWKNIGAMNDRLLSSHPVAAAAIALLEDPKLAPEGKWKSTPGELLKKLDEIAAKERIDTKAKSWPKSANSLSRRLHELRSNLEDAGIHLEIGREDGGKRERYVSLEDVKISSQSSQSSQTASNQKNLRDDLRDDIGDRGSLISSLGEERSDPRDDIGDDFRDDIDQISSLNELSNDAVLGRWDDRDDKSSLLLEEDDDSPW
ncbi:MAG: hypothetical protein GX493_06155 [Firmicutes bacterium]|nr:hypothetical protein [Bacillota bacterium]